MPSLLTHYQKLRDRIITGTLSALPDEAMLTGHPENRLPHNASFAFRNISGNDLLMHLDLAGIAASSGSACRSGNPRPSATLEALGLAPEWTKGGLRITVGRQNTITDINRLLSVLPKTVMRLRTLEKNYA
jgi:cysteine desulfurase